MEICAGSASHGPWTYLSPRPRKKTRAARDAARAAPVDLRAEMQKRRSQRAGAARASSVTTGLAPLRQVLYASSSESSSGVETRFRRNPISAVGRQYRGRAPRCDCGRWWRAGGCRRRVSYVTSGRSRRGRPGVRYRRGRGRSGPRWPRIARKRMISAPNAAFRVDRSPPLCSAGRFDIRELLHDDLHRL